MAIDPISGGLAAAGFIANLIKSQQQRKQAQQGIALQQQLLSSALSEARGLGRERLGAAQRGAADIRNLAGAARTDQYGNITYYDPATNRWTTAFTPAQRELIQRGEERQKRAAVRGAQAEEDYARARAGYLYRPTPSEEAIRAEITQLINQAMGTGEQQERALAERFRVRTAGNIPQIGYAGNGPTAGQRLAETMLRAREAALSEYGTRQEQRAREFLPAMAQFEKTAQYVAPEGPTGGETGRTQSEIAGNVLKAALAGQQDISGAYSDLGRQITSLYGGAGGDIGSAAAGATKAAGAGPGMNEFTQLINALRPTAAQLRAEQAGAGTVGATKGARVAASGGSEFTLPKGRVMRPYSAAAHRGVGGEAAPFGGAPYPEEAAAWALEDRFGLWEQPSAKKQWFRPSASWQF